MKSTSKMLLAAGAAALLAITPAGAKSVTAPLSADGADTYNGCYGGGYYGGYQGGHYRGGYRSHFSSGHYGGHRVHAYRTRCRVIDRHYFWRGSCRWVRITYLHERIDSCGRVVSCWRTCKTLRA